MVVMAVTVVMAVVVEKEEMAVLLPANVELARGVKEVMAATVVTVVMVAMRVTAVTSILLTRKAEVRRSRPGRLAVLVVKAAMVALVVLAVVAVQVVPEVHRVVVVHRGPQELPEKPVLSVQFISTAKNNNRKEELWSQILKYRVLRV
ncbi:hypothetical protein XIS1_130011 [Xenorhabdus innexi]|uniref:Uncharacterized protein n=1 Tax=Xenorhabdus innexi TaxID=290109 RepID=A0A1N6MSX5_9GAMM|nr:hypothetical protein XIS1_130011 [Xenorhabdus innexi]